MFPTIFKLTQIPKFITTHFCDICFWSPFNCIIFALPVVLSVSAITSGATFINGIAHTARQLTSQMIVLVTPIGSLLFIVFCIVSFMNLICRVDFQQQWWWRQQLPWSHAASQHHKTSYSVTVLIEWPLEAEVTYCMFNIDISQRRASVE